MGQLEWLDNWEEHGKIKSIRPILSPTYPSPNWPEPILCWIYQWKSVDFTSLLIILSENLIRTKGSWQHHSSWRSSLFGIWMEYPPPPPPPPPSSNLIKTESVDAPLHAIGFELEDLSPEKVTGRLQVTLKCCQVLFFYPSFLISNLFFKSPPSVVRYFFLSFLISKFFFFFFFSLFLIKSHISSVHCIFTEWSFPFLFISILLLCINVGNSNYLWVLKLVIRCRPIHRWIFVLLY